MAHQSTAGLRDCDAAKVSNILKTPELSVSATRLTDELLSYMSSQRLQTLHGLRLLRPATREPKTQPHMTTRVKMMKLLKAFK